MAEKYGWDVCYTKVDSGALAVDTWVTEIGDCLLYRERFGCHIVVHGTSATESFDMMVVQAGSARFFGEEVSSTRVALFPPESEVDAVGLPGLETLHIQVPKERLEASADTLGVDLSRPARMRVVEPGVDRLDRVRGALERAIQILEEEDLAAWKEVEDDLLVTLVAIFDRSFHRNPVPKDRLEPPTSHALAVGRYVLSADLDELDLAGVSESLGIGRHHLNRCFKQHYGVSIQEFVHLRRLHHARDLLLKSPTELTVTDAAYTSGFRHLGRFSTEYKQLFGESPRQTLKRTEPIS